MPVNPESINDIQNIRCNQQRTRRDVCTECNRRIDTGSGQRRERNRSSRTRFRSPVRIQTTTRSGSPITANTDRPEYHSPPPPLSRQRRPLVPDAPFRSIFNDHRTRAILRRSMATRQLFNLIDRSDDRANSGYVLAEMLNDPTGPITRRSFTQQQSPPHPQSTLGDDTNGINDNTAATTATATEDINPQSSSEFAEVNYSSVDTDTTDTDTDTGTDTGTDTDSVDTVVIEDLNSNSNLNA